MAADYMFCFVCKRKTVWTPWLVVTCTECRDSMTDDQWENTKDRMWEHMHGKQWVEKWGNRHNEAAYFAEHGTVIT